MDVSIYAMDDTGDNMTRAIDDPGISPDVSWPWEEGSSG